MICERKGAVDREVDLSWSDHSGDRTYECRVLLCPEQDGGYSAHALRLPGIVTQGETIEEALENIRDAFQSVIQTYLESGGTVPWQPCEEDRPRGSMERWILVNV